MTEGPWMTFEEAQQILAALERAGVEYVLVGAMAMAAQGLVRGTARHGSLRSAWSGERRAAEEGSEVALR